MASLPLFRRGPAPAGPDTHLAPEIHEPGEPDAYEPDHASDLLLVPARAEPDSAMHDARRRAIRAISRTTLIVLAALAVLWGYSTPALAATIATLRWLDAHNAHTARAVLTVALVAGGALVLVVAWSRATAPRRPVRLAGGRGTIAVAELERRLESLWLERDDVVAARAAVENRHRHGVRVAARLAVTADARLSETAAAAALATGMLVERQIGVALAAAPRFELRYRELDLRAGRAHDIRAARPERRDAAGNDLAG